MSWTTCMGKNISCDDGSIDTVFIDPDVAGYGVLAAFLVTGLASVGAMYWAYFNDCLDGIPTNPVDNIVLAWIHNFSLFRKSSKEEDNAQKEEEIAKKEEEIAKKKVRTKALEQFVLTLSDQQLVTGFAILIASFALRCSISVLNFEIASSLAWFSSVTHLATLAILREYFHKHVWMRRIRLACMMAVITMLLATIYTAIDYWDLVLPVQCSYANIADGGPASFGFSTQILEGSWVTGWLQIYLFLVYGNRIVDLSTKERKLVTWLNELLRNRLRKKYSDLDLFTPLKTHEKTAIKAVDENQLRRLVQRFFYQLNLMYVLFLDLTRSFFWELILATFGFCYGVMQVSVNLWQLPQGYMRLNADNVLISLDISYGSMAFGQLIPPLLLLLPILAALEAYEDANIAKNEKEKSEAENTDPPPPNETPEGASRNDSHKSTGSVQVGISGDPEQTNGHSSRRLPESKSCASRDLFGNSQTIQFAPAKGQATQPSISSKKASEVSMCQIEDPELFENIYSHEGTPWRVIFLIFISYGVAGVFSAILAGLLDIPGFWFPYACTVVWIVWYFWDVGITFARVLRRTPLGKIRRRNVAARAEGV